MTIATTIKHKNSKTAALLKVACAVGFLALSTAETAAQNAQGKAYLLQQAVSLPASPESALVIVEVGPGTVSQFPAGFVELPTNVQNLATRKQRLLGAAVPINSLPSHQTPVQFTFFAVTKDASVSATPVKKWTSQELGANSRPTAQLKQESQQLQLDIESLRKEQTEITEQLNRQKEKASSLAGIDEIVNLKMRYAFLTSHQDEQNRTVEQLRKTIERARDQLPPADVDRRRQELSISLKETARRTAIARRLTARKQESAVAGFQKKLELIKQYEGVDAEALAREVLTLRIQRKQLQEKLRGTPKPAAVDDF